MPELPEVEHVRRRLERALGRDTIEAAEALDPIVVPQPRAAFGQALVGRRALRLDRLGKNVRVELDGGRALWFHLGMTGHLVVDDRAPEQALPRFCRWWIATSRRRICLTDARRLGRAFAGTPAAVAETARLERLGPDALGLGTAALRARRPRRVRRPRQGRRALPALQDAHRPAGRPRPLELPLSPLPAPTPPRGPTHDREEAAPQKGRMGNGGP